MSTTAAIREAAFKQDFRNVMSSIDPAGGGKRIKRRDQHAPDYLGDIRSDDMLPNLALSAVYQAAGLANRKLTEEDAGRYALRVATLFRPHLEVLREMWIRVVTTGFDIDHPKRHRANIVWDMYIAALASGVIDGQPVLLVTGDSMIIEACGRAGCINGVSRLADYLDSIGISWLA
ncbi:MAG: hypothetical protein Q7T82_03790 [Armatimonadota bacterium]|nr:hypothetical protein [Armatimonadota bacterium]